MKLKTPVVFLLRRRRLALCLPWVLTATMAGQAAAQEAVPSTPYTSLPNVDVNISDGSVELSLEDAILISLRRNLGLQVQRIRRQQAIEGVELSRGIFDLGLGSTASFSSSSQPAASQLQGADVSKSETQVLNFSLDQLTPAGGTVSFEFNNARQESNNIFFSINPSFTVNMDALFSQPLLAGFGKTVTKRRILIAPRGVGKTSLARIFAKALNCKTGPTPTPCSKCQVCQDIEGGSSLDVIEIDGASNRGIDDVRAIRENVKFAPANGKFKIYIIDEVHQITQDGFNALLKTLEEPPPHVKFIFATTAPQKVPPTILSRCQRFDFKRIPTPQIVDVLTNITKKEKFKISQDALLEIAKIADGSLRDSQSLLDQVASFSKEKITFEDVSEALGLLSEEEPTARR